MTFLFQKIPGRLILLILALASCAFLAACVPQEVAQPDKNVALLQDCKFKIQGAGVYLDARCAKISVPEDRSKNGGASINLNVVVYPAVNRNPQADPVFLLAGGPGEAATQSFPLMMDAFARIHQDRDLVMVDQRGTGDSHPLTCPVSEDSKNGDVNFDISFDESLEDIKTCREALDGDPRFYTTQAAIDDLEEVRQVLGYEQINLMGVSYGTRVALAYLRQYGQNVRTVTIDSVNPIDWELGPHNPANAQRALDLIFERCAAESDCHQAFPNIKEEFKQLLDRLDKEPVKVTMRHPVTAENIDITLDRKQLGFVLQILSYEPETAALIPLLLHSAYQDGSYNLLLAQALTSQQGLSSSISDGLYLSVLCAEDAPFYPAENPEEKNVYLINPAPQMSSICKAWNTPAVSAAFKQPVASDRPVLLLTGEADPITPPANALAAAQSLPNSLTVVAPGMGHAVFTRGCFPKIMADFINNGGTNGLDTTCVEKIKPQPFFVSFSGTQP